jgi:hypothetical protein
MDELPPMWADWTSASDRHRHFYTKELAQIDNGAYVIILRWVTVKSQVYVEVLYTDSCEIDSGVLQIKVSSNRKFHLPATRLHRNIMDIQYTYPQGIKPCCE